MAARYPGPLSYDHPGQLAWGSIFDSREAPAVIVNGDADGILEAPHWLRVGGNPDRAGGPGHPSDTWFVQQVIDLAVVTLPEIEGYRFRHVHRDEAAARAACHHAAWSDAAPSGMSAQMYERLMETPYYDAGLDWVAVAEHSGEMAASCTVWRCGDVALVEPVGCSSAHRRRGLGSGVTLAALVAAREDGAATGIVRPRGDSGYPVPVRLYRSIGFTDRRAPGSSVSPDGVGHHHLGAGYATCLSRGLLGFRRPQDPEIRCLCAVIRNLSARYFGRAFVGRTWWNSDSTCSGWPR